MKKFILTTAALALCLLQVQTSQAQSTGDTFFEVVTQATSSAAIVKGDKAQGCGTRTDFNVSAQGRTIQLQNLSTGPAQQFIWDFGDNTFHVGPNPAPHTYLQNGTYTLSLQLVDNCGTSNMVKLVTVFSRQ